MHRRTTRLNRIVFVLLGIVLLAAGGFLLARHFDWIDRLPSTERIYSSSEARWLHGNTWVWYVVAAAAVIVGLLALRWLLVQPRIDRVRRLRPDADLEQHGRTAMASSVLTDAVEDDIDALPGVARSRVIVTGATDAPELVVRVAAKQAADLAEMHRRVVTEAVASARIALDDETVPVQVHLVVNGRRTAKRAVL